MKKFFLFLTFSLPLITFAKTEQIQIDGELGKLSAIKQVPDEKENYPLVILMHGFTSNKEFKLLSQTADLLEKAGIASIRFDFNGHGDSEGDFEKMTVLNELSDAKKVYEYAEKLEQVSSISLAGHSQGGVVASMLAGQLGKEKIKNLVLLAPAAVLRDDALRGSIFMNNFDAINPPEYLDLNFPDGRKFKLGKDYITTAQNLEIFETAKNYQGNSAIIHGKADTVVPYTYGQRYNYVLPNSQLHLIDKANHGFSEHTEEVAKLIVAFFKDKLL